MASGRSWDAKRRSTSRRPHPSSYASPELAGAADRAFICSSTRPGASPARRCPPVSLTTALDPELMPTDTKLSPQARPHSLVSWNCKCALVIGPSRLIPRPPVHHAFIPPPPPPRTPPHPTRPRLLSPPSIGTLTARGSSTTHTRISSQFIPTAPHIPPRRVRASSQNIARDIAYPQAMSLSRGIQSAIFHYLSCAPCSGYMYRSRRRKQAKHDRKEKNKLEMEQPELYRHPEPSATNPFWAEEIFMGPGPPRRAGRKTNTSSQRGITTADTHSTVASNGGSSLDIGSSDGKPVRVSGDTLRGDNWNRRRYQREDEELWGLGEAVMQAGSSVGLSGITRPPTARTAKSSGESYYHPRAPPINDLHPPIVSLPSPHPADNKWMLQPPPRASVMNGKERATNRSRSGSGASSRVEVNLQRQVSTKQLKAKLDRGETPEMPPLSRGSSYSNAQGQGHDRDPKAPRAAPPSATPSRRKRRDPSPEKPADSSTESSDTIVYPSRDSTPQLTSQPSLKVVRVRSSRQKLSTVVSSGDASPPSKNLLSKAVSSPSQTDKSSGSLRVTRPRPPLAASDLSSLNILQDLVSPRALLNSRYVSAPLVEARIKLPEVDRDEETLLVGQEDITWVDNGFGQSREWQDDESHSRAPSRDPRTRWSVDF
ncbi:uncharacterized protein BDZ99DRAFT_521781 [Mytilinidion resinicola]|uniref:Uncharacterized protein n=1 Tax=Mytilinidion resinicola TaxID=574789 RepID=A0A6A6YI59_9PEZI|nr:uncharacterized protein BDZ99DRAFT_521781 [Mytilinidion resinicola]KAF2808213.1 hypothetical protein BDZ99DRAFT_521781 [Mytilinidion resinicola]